MDELIKGRISDYRINNTNIKKLAFEKVMSENEVFIENCVIDSLDIDNLKVKNGSITFKNCKFNTLVSLKNIKMKGSINFIECASECNIKFFKVTLENELIFDYHKSDNKLEIIDMNLASLTINNSIFSNINIFSNTTNKISKLRVNKSEVLKKIDINNIESIDSLIVDDSKSNDLTIKTTKFNDNARLLVNNSNIIFLQLNYINAQKDLEIKISENIIDICALDYLNIENSEFSISNGFCKTLIIKGNISKSAFIDISSVSTENIDIEPQLYAFLKSSSLDSIFLKKNDQYQNFKVFKIFSSMFAGASQFDFQDICFYHQKNCEIKNTIENTDSFISKIQKSIFLFIGKELFGWGVMLQKIFLSLLYIIFFYSIIYKLFFDEHINGLSYKAIDFTENYFDIFIFSFFNLFGSSSNISTKFYYLEVVMYSQNLVGILVLSLLTGTIIRKLIR